MSALSDLVNKIQAPHFAGLSVKNRLFPPTPQAKYLRVSQLDAPLWDMYLKRAKPNFKYIAYDLPLSIGNELLNDSNGILDHMMKHLTKKRADAIGLSDSGVTIFEVKPRADTRAMGQILGYEYMFKKLFSPALPINKVIITDRITDDDKEIIEANNIEIIFPHLIPITPEPPIEIIQPTA